MSSLSVGEIKLKARTWAGREKGKIAYDIGFHGFGFGRTVIRDLDAPGGAEWIFDALGAARPRHFSLPCRKEK